ncbi:MAG TPA: amidohydrolase family protein [Acidimicrobiales bacterium]|nr:amidohydrolase family protein [Acidimicrobiales bacterium]
MRVISADSHVAVTHDQVKSHLATKWHGTYDAAQTAFADRMARKGAGEANTAAMKQNPHAAFTRPGYRDGSERLKDMDIDGVDAEVVYSEVSAFRYLGDMTEGVAEASRAFNDVLADYASADPKRLIVSYQVQIKDIPAAVQEVQRVAAAGGKSLQLPVFPNEIGLPDYYDQRYAPLWSAVQETGLPICLHIGLNTNLDDLVRRDPTPQKGVMVPMAALSTGEAFGMWIQTGTLERFPELKLVFVEPGLGWVAWYLYIIDDMVQRQGYRFDDLTELPSFYFHRNMALTYIDEPDAIQLLRHRLGVENIMWSSDYPHPVTSWPDSMQLIERSFAGVPDDERDAILCGNAARVWGL